MSVPEVTRDYANSILDPLMKTSHDPTPLNRWHLPLQGLQNINSGWLYKMIKLSCFKCMFILLNAYIIFVNTVICSIFQLYFLIWYHKRQLCVITETSALTTDTRTTGMWGQHSSVCLSLGHMITQSATLEICCCEFGHVLFCHLPTTEETVFMAI